MNRVLVSLCLAGLVAQPLAAQKMSNSAAMEIVELLNSSNEIDVLAGSYLACIAGEGVSERSAMIFEHAGWPRTDDFEMGMIEFRPPNAFDPYIALGASHSYCGVTSNDYGTNITGEILATVVAKVSDGSLGVQRGMSHDGCTTYRIHSIMLAELTSSGQDPSCESTYNSAVHFTGNGNQ